MLDQILKAEATEQIGAESYKRSDNRTTQRNGYRTREFTTRLGIFKLPIPKLRDGTLSDKHRIHLRLPLRDMLNTPSEDEAKRRKDLIVKNHPGKTFSKP